MKRRNRLDLNTPEGRESFINTLSELKSITVIVEGKKDVRALESLGLIKIIPLNNKPLIKLVHDVVNRGIKEIIILTDFDKKGRMLAAKLRTLFEAHKIRINSRLRCKMMKFGKNKIEDFGLVDRRGDDYGKVSTNFDKIHNKGKDKGKRCDRKTRCNRSGFWSN
jgi:2,5-diamino-6-(ribosylamino)-4(3H)-pyrimidinone 5'-phosphate reductase